MCLAADEADEGEILSFQTYCAAFSSLKKLLPDHFLDFVFSQKSVQICPKNSSKTFILFAVYFLSPHPIGSIWDLLLRAAG